MYNNCRKGTNFMIKFKKIKPDFFTKLLFKIRGTIYNIDSFNKM